MNVGRYVFVSQHITATMKMINIQELQQHYLTISVQDQQIPITYRHRTNAKYLKMRLTPHTHQLGVTIILPINCSMEAFAAFILRCKQWLLKQVHRISLINKPAVPFKNGSVLPILGRSLKLDIDDATSSKTIMMEGERLVIPYALRHPSIIRAYLNEQLFDYVSAKSYGYASPLNAALYKISVKPLKSYGICSSKKHISYASKLVFAPMEVIDYVCAHEVAHLIEFNHSPDFWAVVKELIPEYKASKAWIRTYGVTLSAYGKE